jgi:hypothetical protein
MGDAGNRPSVHVSAWGQCRDHNRMKNDRYAKEKRIGNWLELIFSAGAIVSQIADRPW